MIPVDYFVFLQPYPPDQCYCHCSVPNHSHGQGSLFGALRPPYVNRWYLCSCTDFIATELDSQMIRFDSPNKVKVQHGGGSFKLWCSVVSTNTGSGTLYMHVFRSHERGVVNATVINCMIGLFPISGWHVSAVVRRVTHYSSGEYYFEVLIIVRIIKNTCVPLVREICRTA